LDAEAAAEEADTTPESELKPDPDTTAVGKAGATTVLAVMVEEPEFELEVETDATAVEEVVATAVKEVDAMAVEEVDATAVEEVDATAVVVGVDPLATECAEVTIVPVAVALEPVYAYAGDKMAGTDVAGWTVAS